MLHIDEDFYCSGFNYNCGSSVHNGCKCFHRKYPTPEQFKKEYGFEYPQDGAVYVLLNTLGGGTWVPSNLQSMKKLRSLDIAAKTKFLSDKIVCACTPCGKPPANWRSE